ncbi:hypothetical protein ACOME3_000053 [Neoechinorhynchus agilis]
MQSEGIHALLEAEQQASARINEAKKKKARRLKQANEEAMADLEKFKRDRERELELLKEKTKKIREEFESHNRSSNQQNIEEIGRIYERNRKIAIHLFMKACFPTICLTNK